MSIFISIPTLIDNDLEDTLSWAFKKAKNPKDLYIGLAMMTDEKYYLKIKNQFENNKNITIKRFDPKENIGVGIGRKNALSLYTGQDYIMQLDPHTYFEQDWDEKVLLLYKECLEKTKNEKTILTTYLPAWFRLGEIIKSDPYSRYPFFSVVPEDRDHDHSECVHFHLPTYTDMPIKEADIKINTKKKKFLPSVRFCAHFAFSNKNFYLENGLMEESLFFEEEIIQAINLLSLGYYLVFPNVQMPLYHMYTLPTTISSGIKTRQFTEDLMENPRSFFDRVSENFDNFISNPKNLDKCDYYKKYANLDENFKVKKDFYIPKNFSI